MDAREDLLAKAKEVAKKLGRQTISREEFCRHTGISGNQIYQYFEGFRDLCAQAGLVPYEQNVRLDEDQIFVAMRDTFVKLGGIVTRTKFDKHFRYSVDVFKKRGLNWTAALVAFRKWVEQNDPTFPYLDRLPADDAQPRSVDEPGEPVTAANSRSLQSWDSRGG